MGIQHFGQLGQTLKTAVVTVYATALKSYHEKQSCSARAVLHTACYSRRCSCWLQYSLRKEAGGKVAPKSKVHQRTMPCAAQHGAIIIALMIVLDAVWTEPAAVPPATLWRPLLFNAL
jgi:hypothetical protein